MTREEAIKIASMFLMVHDNASIASIMTAKKDKPEMLAHYLRQHIEFLTEVANTIDKKIELWQKKLNYKSLKASAALILL